MDSETFNEISKPMLKEKSIYEVYMDYLKDEIDKHKLAVENFENPGGHFTTEYEIFNGTSVEKLKDVDLYKFPAPERLLKMKKEMLASLKAIKLELRRKVHSNGESCEDCEIKN